ncbi:ABC transporter permease [Mannheimia indoligenes]|uniref:ABC transporter permease n=1 Tax=Mannheimia indoligenes TaxID=3103145 RepID=UPI002FE52E0D
MRSFLQKMPLFRPLVIAFSLLLLWQGAVSFGGMPAYMLPSPLTVWQKLIENAPLLATHAQITLLEIVLGLLLGFLFGLGSALLLTRYKQLSKFLLPLLVISQAIPVFAIAPLLVLWFGYGLASKIVMTVLIIYFPVTAACFDGLRNTPKTWLDLAKTLEISPIAMLFKVQLPAALPSLASGLRIAVSVAPIGAIVGEWIGASQGLGYLMLHANARMQTDLMFAALFILIVIALLLYFVTDKLLKRLVPWATHLH